MSKPGDFWSRRKQAVEAEAEHDAVLRADQELATETAALEEKTDDEILAELNLPDPDSLKMGDDFSAFMSKAVPDRLRRRALRKLWLSNPVLANVDNLVDYGGDFTDSATVVENMQTAYQVGKGMLKHVHEMARQEAEKENAERDEALGIVKSEAVVPDVDAADEPVALMQETALQDEAPEPAQGEGAHHYFDQDEETHMAAPAPRRMKFRFEAQTT